MAGDNYRQTVAHRARNRCEYCRYPEAASSTPLEVDHVVPEARGGASTLDNLAFCCRSRNLHKYVKAEAVDSLTNETAPLFNPRTQEWREHFTLDHDTGVIHGVSPEGRATVEALSLNSPHALATRQLLLRLGLMLN